MVAGIAAQSKRAPYIFVLGSAQDGGVPQIGCHCANCSAARRDPLARRYVASLLIVDPVESKRFLIDATPNLPSQLERADQFAPRPAPSGFRPPLFDAVFITHAHVGHYTGLVYFGREMYGADRQSVLATERVCDFIRSNAPWEMLVSAGHIELTSIVPGRQIPLTKRLAITPILVPHRGEYSDTVAYLVRGPDRSLFYVPDTDAWEPWDRPIEDYIAETDFALLDGTFFDDGEVRGRSISEIPHPRIAHSIERFGALAPKDRDKVHFTHLNHSNPVCDPGSAEYRAVIEAGMCVVREGQVFEL
jgi:pyrroloquinoline quinone biosynthesis protein B